jgi:hypothetical protein
MGMGWRIRNRSRRYYRDHVNWSILVNTKNGDNPLNRKKEGGFVTPNQPPFIYIFFTILKYSSSVIPFSKMTFAAFFPTYRKCQGSYW